MEMRSAKKGEKRRYMLENPPLRWSISWPTAFGHDKHLRHETRPWRWMYI